MRTQRITLALIAVLVGAAAVLELLVVHLAAPLDQAMLDHFVRRQTAALPPDPEIVIVDIDDASLRRMQDEAGPFPWPRRVYVELVRGLAKQQPQAIVFDVLFSEPDSLRPGDAELAEALRDTPNVYVPMLRGDPREDAQGVPVRQFAAALGIERTPSARPDARAALILPLALPQELWRRAGTINPREDSDGVCRSYALYEDLSGWRLPSLPARLARAFGWTVPRQGDALELAWRGPIGSFRCVAFADVYADLQRQSPQRPADEFRDKLVIVGASAVGVADRRPTPRGSLDQGVEILATALDNLKNGRAVREPHAAPVLGFSLLLITWLLAAFVAGANLRTVGAFLLLLTLGVFGTTFFAAAHDWRVPLLAPMSFVWLYFLIVAMIESRKQRAERRHALQVELHEPWGS